MTIKMRRLLEEIDRRLSSLGVPTTDELRVAIYEVLRK